MAKKRSKKSIRSTILDKIGLACLFLAIGISIGENHRGKGPFFRSWYGNDKELYYGEEVKLHPTLKGSNFYNKECKKMVIAGLRAASDYNAAWVALVDCSWVKDHMIFSTFNQDDLEKK